MSFFKKVFSKSAKPERKLTHPSKLLVGDIIALTDSFALPQALRGQQLQITAINTYEFEHHNQIEWTLQGSGQHLLFLSLEADDHTELKFSIKLEHQDVETLFNLDDFAEIFEQPGKAFLTRQRDNECTTMWSAEQYQQSVFAKVGYFHRKDHRNENLSAYEGKDSGEQFELYVLYNQEQSQGIDIEVWQDGDTEVFLTLFRPLSDIVDMYPAS